MSFTSFMFFVLFFFLNCDFEVLTEDFIAYGKDFNYSGIMSSLLFTRIKSIQPY